MGWFRRGPSALEALEEALANVARSRRHVDDVLERVQERHLEQALARDGHLTHAEQMARLEVSGEIADTLASRLDGIDWGRLSARRRAGAGPAEGIVPAPELTPELQELHRAASAAAELPDPERGDELLEACRALLARYDAEL